MSLQRLLMASTIALLCIAGSAVAQQYPKMTLRFAHFVPATLPGATVDQWFADELAKRTGGQITMQIFWAESMGKSMELLKMASQGGVDIAATAAGYFPSQIPMLAAATIPFAKSAKQAKTVWTKLYNETPALQDEARRAGVVPLLWHPIPTYHLIGRAPVRTLDDLKGKRVRSFGEEFPRLLRAVGATPVTVLPGEWYESIQRGSIDYMLHSWDTLATFKIYEVAKQASLINLGALISWPQWWNLKKWESLPPDVKALLVDLVHEADALEIARLHAAEEKAIETMKASGVQFTPFPDQDKLDKLTPDYLAEWAAKLETLGEGAQARAMLARWQELLRQTSQ
jgi:TRAP-type C4-dicarboxylate transport system substrate-binding protein